MPDIRVAVAARARQVGMPSVRDRLVRRFGKWRGVKALVHDAVDATTDLVHEGHESTARTVRRVTDEIEPIREPARIVDGIRRVSTLAVLTTIKVINRAVEVVTDVGLDAAERAYPPDGDETREPLPMRSDAAGSLPWVGDAAIGLVNAAVGDHLGRRDNGLEMAMLFRAGDRYVPLEPDALRVALPHATDKVALFVHGLGTTEWSWCLEAEAYHGDPGVSFGSLLERDLGFTPIYLRYNTGRHVSENGRELAAQLERFLDAYPVPIEDLTLIGHSMGGLVVRSACHYGEQAGCGWVPRVRRVFCLGAPHRGAPLAKLAHALGGLLGTIDLPGTRITARIIEGSSSGIKDLRHGAVVDEDWLARIPDASNDSPLLPHARHFFFSATITKDPDHAIGQLVGDLMVRVPSAAGPAVREQHFAIETGRYGGVLHHQLQNHPAVYEQVRRGCERGSG